MRSSRSIRGRLALSRNVRSKLLPATATSRPRLPPAMRCVGRRRYSALRRFRREGDELWEARLLFNRGLLHLDRGELERAEADVRRARELYARTGDEAAVANVLPVLAGISVLRGEILDCLKILEEVPA